VNEEKHFLRLAGKKKREETVQRLDQLMQDKSRQTAAQTLKDVHSLVKNMMVVIDGEKSTNLSAHWLLRISPCRRQGNKF
jgi:hypothetical protein